VDAFFFKYAGAGADNGPAHDVLTKQVTFINMDNGLLLNWCDRSTITGELGAPPAACLICWLANQGSWYV
jgi:hypothetical protein